MRATFEVQDDLLREAEALAARSGRSLDEVVEEALRTLLRRAGAVSRGGLRPGVEVEDSAALFGLMERGSRYPGLDLDQPSGPEERA